MYQKWSRVWKESFCRYIETHGCGVLGQKTQFQRYQSQGRGILDGPRGTTWRRKCSCFIRISRHGWAYDASITRYRVLVDNWQVPLQPPRYFTWQSSLLEFKRRDEHVSIWLQIHTRIMKEWNKLKEARTGTLKNKGYRWVILLAMHFKDIHGSLNVSNRFWNHGRHSLLSQMV